MKRSISTLTTQAVLLVGLSLWLPAPPARAALSVTVAGDWRLGLTRQTLVGRPGSDLSMILESDPGTAALTVSGAVDGNQRWCVQISRSDTRWHPDLRLQVRRGSGGVGAGVLRGGLAYQTVETVPGTLLIGCGNRLQVPLQFRLCGFSARVPPAQYATALTYTVVGLQ